MSSIDEHILKASKEIIVKFIETGRVSPVGFPEAFKSIYKAVEEVVKGETVSNAGNSEESREQKSRSGS